MKLSAVSMESLWLILTGRFLTWSFASHCIMEIAIFMVVDFVVKIFLKETRSVRERYKIWLYESLTLLLISGVIAVTYHRPIVLWSLTVGTFCYTMSYGKTQEPPSGFILSARSNRDSSCITPDDTPMQEVPGNTAYKPLARQGIRQRREPLQLGDTSELKTSSLVTSMSSDTKIVNPATAGLKHDVRLSSSFPKLSSHQNTRLTDKVWSCFGYNTVAIPPGLRNSGQNVCFINSVLQCLAHTPSFANLLANQVHSASLSQSEMTLVTSLCNLLQSLDVLPESGSKRVVSTAAFRCTANKLCPTLIANPIHEVQSQQDAAEFLTWLFSSLQTILNRKRALSSVNSSDSSLQSTQSSAAAEMESTLLFVYGDLSDSRISELKEHFRREIECANGLEVDTYADAVTSLSDLEWLCYCRSNSSTIDELFSGQLVDVRRCLMCNRVSVTMETFTVLPVPITESDLANQILTVHLHQCFEKFSNVEELNGQDSLTCTCTRGGMQRKVAGLTRRRSLRIKQRINRSFSDSGLLDSSDSSAYNGDIDNDSSSSSSSSGSFVPGQRRSLVRKLPQCLVIQLMRFQYDPVRLTTCKRHTPIHVPITNFDLRDLVFDTFTNRESGIVTGYTYDLCGVCLHLGGQGASCGHYISYGLAMDDKWYKFDDDIVTLVADMYEECNTDLFKENAYLLFYKRQQ